MGITKDLYKFVLVLHIAAAIIGFGGTFVAGLYGAKAGARGGTEGRAIAEASFEITNLVPAMAIYSVPVLGILLILLSDDVWKFSQMWVSISFVIYIAAIVLVQVVHLPNLRAMNSLMAGMGQGGPSAATAGAELAQRGKKAAMVGGVLNLAWVLVLFMMVFKPGL